MLPTYLYNSVLLMFGVGAFVSIIGTGTAWLVAMCEFPGSRFFAWALILPMAMPAYVVAYVYTDFLEFAGPVRASHVTDPFRMKRGLPLNAEPLGLFRLPYSF